MTKEQLNGARLPLAWERRLLPQSEDFFGNCNGPPSPPQFLFHRLK